jgi:hypothetical protein
MPKLSLWILGYSSMVYILVAAIELPNSEMCLSIGTCDWFGVLQMRGCDRPRSNQLRTCKKGFPQASHRLQGSRVAN